MDNANQDLGCVWWPARQNAIDDKADPSLESCWGNGDDALVIFGFPTASQHISILDNVIRDAELPAVLPG